MSLAEQHTVSPEVWQQLGAYLHNQDARLLSGRQRQDSGRNGSPSPGQRKPWKTPC